MIRSPGGCDSHPVEERHTIPRYPYPSADERILDRIYKHIEAAQLSKRIGGHYKCTLFAASVLLDGLLERRYRNPDAGNGRLNLADIWGTIPPK